MSVIAWGNALHIQDPVTTAISRAGGPVLNQTNIAGLKTRSPADAFTFDSTTDTFTLDIGLNTTQPCIMVALLNCSFDAVKVTRVQLYVSGGTVLYYDTNTEPFNYIQRAIYENYTLTGWDNFFLLNLDPSAPGDAVGDRVVITMSLTEIGTGRIGALWISDALDVSVALESPDWGGLDLATKDVTLGGSVYAEEQPVLDTFAFRLNKLTQYMAWNDVRSINHLRKSVGKTRPVIMAPFAKNGSNSTSNQVIYGTFDKTPSIKPIPSRDENGDLRYYTDMAITEER